LQQVIQSLFWLIGSASEFFAGILLTLSIFRFPIQYVYGRVALFAGILALIIHYTYFILGLQSITVVTNLALITIFYTLFLKMPFFKSLLLSVIGVFCSIVVEVSSLAFLVAVEAGETQQISSTKWFGGLNFIIAAVILATITLILQRYKIGFVLSGSQWSANRLLKPYNFILVCASLLLLIIIVFINAHSDEMPYLIFAAILFSSISAFIIRRIYNKNIEILLERSKRMDQTLEKFNDKSPY
jgi:hypothetical protein